MSDENSRRCSELCSNYLLGNRKNLKRVLLLIDARHGLKIGDKEYFRELIYGPPQLDSLGEKIANLYTISNNKLYNTFFHVFFQMVHMMILANLYQALSKFVLRYTGNFK